MPIRILDAATVGRIAAGEVVERPSVGGQGAGGKFAWTPARPP